MFTVYDKNGKAIKINYAIDVQAAINSGEYFKENPRTANKEEVKEAPKEEEKKQYSFGKEKK